MNRMNLAVAASPSTPEATETSLVSSSRFFAQYHGHPVDSLRTIVTSLKRRGGADSLIFFVGDSSLDNKYWLAGDLPACNGYEAVLQPPRCKADVAYWLNHHLERSGNGLRDGTGEGPKLACVNTAVEATTLNERMMSGLLEQDRLVQEHISDRDFLVVSIGGNDIALAPTPCTIAALANMVCCTTEGCLAGGVSLSLPYFKWMFKTRVQRYISRLLGTARPRKILVCMIYYPDESNAEPSWADLALGCMGYNRCPGKLQLAIRQMFDRATSQIQIDGVEVVPVPLFRALDGKDTTDYVARVEPSAVGGEKMALEILSHILPEVFGPKGSQAPPAGVGTPLQPTMQH